MPIPANFNLSSDGYITIEMTILPNGLHELNRNCIGIEQNLILMVVAAMVKQPELREVLLKSVAFYQANKHEVHDIINKKF